MYPAMRYDDPKLLDALAREYVLGTLHGRARARFARVLAARSRRAARCSAGSGSSRRSPPPCRAVEPPPDVVAADRSGDRARTRAPACGVGAWQALAAGLAALAIFFGGAVSRPGAARRPSAVRRRHRPTRRRARWLLQAFTDGAARQHDQRRGRSRPATRTSFGCCRRRRGPRFARPDSGHRQRDLPLTRAQLAVLAQTSTLAVSLEPAGGSPTGAPTGPVIFTAPLLRV